MELVFWDILHRWDQILTLFINKFHNPASDQFMIFMSERAVWFPLYSLIAFFFVKRLGWKKGLIAIACMGLTLLACDQTSNLLKYSVARLRPCYSSRMIFGGLHVLETRGNFYGFFSAHAANAFGFALCSSILFRYDKTHTYKAYITWILIWATLLSISRIFVGKHYLGDIIVGAVIGCSYGSIIAMAARWVFARFIDKKRPAAIGTSTKDDSTTTKE